MQTERPIRVLVAKVGLDGHDRGAKIIATALRDAGMEVIYTGLRQSPEMVVQAALQEDVDAIGVSILSGAHNTVFPKVIALMKEKDMNDVLLTGGGIIPDEDIKRLRCVEELLANEEIEKFPTISKWARNAQMSGTKLKQRLKQVYGYRLYEFYNKQRLEKAKELISNGVTPKEAGYSIGFSDVSNFTKAFKKEYGYTPGTLSDKATVQKQKQTMP